jgi:hypothetical protein
VEPLEEERPRLSLPEKYKGYRDEEEGPYEIPLITLTPDGKLIIPADSPDKGFYEVITGGVDIAPLYDSGYLYSAHFASGWASEVYEITAR